MPEFIASVPVMLIVVASSVSGSAISRIVPVFLEVVLLPPCIPIIEPDERCVMKIEPLLMLGGMSGFLMSGSGAYIPISVVFLPEPSILIIEY